MPAARKGKRKSRRTAGRKALIAVSGNTVMVGYAKRISKRGLAAEVKRYARSKDKLALVADLTLIVTGYEASVSILGGPWGGPPPR